MVQLGEDAGLLVEQAAPTLEVGSFLGVADQDAALFVPLTEALREVFLDCDLVVAVLVLGQVDQTEPPPLPISLVIR